MKALVFPCGSEIGLEVARSLTHMDLYGASSVLDHGRVVYDQYHELPWLNDPDFPGKLDDLLTKLQIDAVYPANDAALYWFATHQIRCGVIGSPAETCITARSKKATYERLRAVVRTPELYTVTPLGHYFVKPDVGAGSKGARQAIGRIDLQPGELMMEYLPGHEITVDCFTDRHGKLRFVCPRYRLRTSAGISTQTAIMKLTPEIQTIAEKINGAMTFRGAWFFQLKRDKRSVWTLLEVAPRIAGSSGIHRYRGINLPLLTIYDYLDKDVTILTTQFRVEMERCWSTKCLIDIDYKHVYVDFDDCLYLKDKLNPTLMHFLVQCLNEGKKLHLISRHKGNMLAALHRLRLDYFFDNVVHLTNGESKSVWILERPAIFIDDSFKEREEVYNALGIPVFAVDAVEGLLR